MGFLRFRRSFRIAHGLRLNLSKSRVSASVGCRGLWFTAGLRGTRETVGISGSGLSYTAQQSLGAAAHPVPTSTRQADDGASTPASSSGGSRVLVWFAVMVLVLIVVALATWR